MAEIGALPNGGVRRLALHPNERTSGEGVIPSWCRQAGLDVTIDQMGSVFARKKPTVAT